MPRTLATPRPSAVRARTRAALLEAALRVFARRGSGAAAIHEITAEAGVANGTFYNYFRSREELVEAASLRLAEGLSEDITASSAAVSDPAERVAIGCRRFLLRAGEDPTWGFALLRVWVQAASLGERVNAAVLRDLRAGRRRGRFHYASEQAAADLVQGSVLAAMRRVLEDGARDGHASAVAALVLRGLGVPGSEADAIARGALPASVSAPFDPSTALRPRAARATPRSPSRRGRSSRRRRRARCRRRGRRRARAARTLAHAVGAEAPVVRAQLAPGREGPLAAPEVEAERARVAHAVGAVLARVVEVHEAALADRAAQQRQRAGHRAGARQLGREERRLEHDAAQRLGQHGLDLRHRARRPPCASSGVAPGGHDARAEHQAFELVAGEDQRRQLVAALEAVADPGLSLDRDARGLEIRDVAVDGALRDGELVGDLLAGGEAPRAQELHQAEQAVSAAHGVLRSRAEAHRVPRRIRHHGDHRVAVLRRRHQHLAAEGARLGDRGAEIRHAGVEGDPPGGLGRGQRAAPEGPRPARGARRRGGAARAWKGRSANLEAPA